jgi:hypothetical protein
MIKSEIDPVLSFSLSFVMSANVDMPEKEMIDQIERGSSREVHSSALESILVLYCFVRTDKCPSLLSSVNLQRCLYSIWDEVRKSNAFTSSKRMPRGIITFSFVTILLSIGNCFHSFSCSFPLAFYFLRLANITTGA